MSGGLDTYNKALNTIIWYKIKCSWYTLYISKSILCIEMDFTALNTVLKI